MTCNASIRSHSAIIPDSVMRAIDTYVGKPAPSLATFRRRSIAVTSFLFAAIASIFQTVCGSFTDRGWSGRVLLPLAGLPGRLMIGSSSHVLSGPWRFSKRRTNALYSSFVMSCIGLWLILYQRSPRRSIGNPVMGRIVNGIGPGLHECDDNFENPLIVLMFASATI
jgi:hypothetical protein